MIYCNKLKKTQGTACRSDVAEATIMTKDTVIDLSDESSPR